MAHHYTYSVIAAEAAKTPPNVIVGITGNGNMKYGRKGKKGVMLIINRNGDLFYRAFFADMPTAHKCFHKWLPYMYPGDSFAPEAE